MVYVELVNGIINQLVTGGAPPCRGGVSLLNGFFEATNITGNPDIIGYITIGFISQVHPQVAMLGAYRRD